MKDSNIVELFHFFVLYISHLLARPFAIEIEAWLEPVQSILIAQIESNVTFDFLPSMPFDRFLFSVTYVVFH